jgi:hypothetical protein
MVELGWSHETRFRSILASHPSKASCKPTKSFPARFVLMSASLFCVKESSEGLIEERSFRLLSRISPSPPEDREEHTTVLTSCKIHARRSEWYRSYRGHTTIFCGFQVGKKKINSAIASHRVSGDRYGGATDYSTNPLARNWTA